MIANTELKMKFLFNFSDGLDQECIFVWLAVDDAGADNFGFCGLVGLCCGPCFWVFLFWKVSSF